MGSQILVQSINGQYYVYCQNSNMCYKKKICKGMDTRNMERALEQFAVSQNIHDEKCRIISRDIFEDEVSKMIVLARKDF